MTSLDFFPPSDHSAGEPRLWGTGKLANEKVNMWTPKPPTWHCSGEPLEQSYSLTDLQLSNCRLNDQLVPNPQHCEMGKSMINLPFPAEHPFSSHISRTAMFPRLTTQEGAAKAFDVIVVSKTKGSGVRHEIQSMPSESQKEPLSWHSHDFDQKLKYPGSAKQNYYPTPPVLINPNSEGRTDDHCIRGDMVVSARTAETAKNLERELWTTTYDRNYTGLGPANPNELDNFLQPTIDGQLRPATSRTFDPPRPKEGRIARNMSDPPPPQTSAGFPEYAKDPTYQRKMTLSEKEEDRLLNGAKYVNLPESYNAVDSEALVQHPSREVNGFQSGPDILQVEHEDPIDELALQQHDRHQQMEAENRWKLLESQKPEHNILARRHKMELASTKQQPAVFYSHEGQFQRERSGLYKTTYDPSALQHSMNKDEKTGARLMDHSDCHKNALDFPTALNNDMANAIRYNRTLGNPGSVPQLHDQPSLYEAIGPFDTAKSLQKAALQPNAQTSDMKTQEGHLLNKESTHGDSYNTKKFLQENMLPRHARNEPLLLMSNDNQNLNNVRLTTTPCPTAGRPLRVPDDILTGDPLPGFNWLSKSCDFDQPRPSSSPELGFKRYSYSSFNADQGVPLGSSAPVTRLQSRHTNQFLSKSTNFMPSTTGSWQTALPSDYKPKIDLSLKTDLPTWKAGSGKPRPQSRLLDIQDSFSKSAVRKQFHERFPENGVDLRENITSGRRHNFAGINAQVLRGAPVVD